MVCIDETLDASRMVAAGWAVAGIRGYIGRTYAYH
jgi:hypothetical protein